MYKPPIQDYAMLPKDAKVKYMQFGQTKNKAFVPFGIPFGLKAGLFICAAIALILIIFK